MPLSPLLNRLERLIKADIRYLIRGNFWLVAARIISVGFGILLSVAFANVLSPDTYGFYKYVLSIAGMTGAFSLTGLYTALTNSIARGDLGTLRTTLWSSVRWSLLASAITLAVAAYYAIHSNYALALSLLIVAVCSPVLSSAGNYRALFSGLPDFKAGALWSIPRSVLPTAAMIAAVFVTQNPVIIVGVYFVSNVLTVIWLYRRAIWKWHVPATAESTLSTIRFARYNSVLSIFYQVASQVDQFLVWHFVGAAGVAYYSFATSPVEQILSFSGNFSALVTPKFAKKKTDAEVFASIPLRIKQMLFVVVPLTAAYILAAPFIFKYLFPKYVGVVVYSQLYSIILILQPLGFIDVALVARESRGIRNFFVLVGQLMKLLLLFVGVWKYGILGGVVALVISEIFNSVIGLGILIYVRKRHLS
ncbi:MAG: oligosaccharide flippase family protein [Patescibacteria group bacterium]|nr:oligosaccharide flippase family protein [Patescibacteria group bacterium]